MENETIRERYGPWALIAGASEGLGAAFAHAAAARGLNTVLVARRGDALEGVAAEIRAEHEVATRQVVADLSEVDAPLLIATALSDLEIGMLIVNAASEPQGPFLDLPLAKHLFAIDVNCRAPLALAHHFGQEMVARKRGSIVLVTSLGGLCGLPLFSSYGASKAFGWNLGECLWDELKPHDVDALSFVVGSTRTPNLERSGAPETHLRDAVAPQIVAENLFEVLDGGPTQYSQPEVEEAADRLFKISRQEAVGFFSEQNHATFPSKAN
ncbi:MAG: SDR family NAD(P)-dependent oxidoreductase [bacterium]|nr:short-chain dehydrogenase [Deltaproteobacteria bacterium]MCP4903977.1 SDR family NAD(P)-dependent oxidoreductase [bacterium]